MDKQIDKMKDTETKIDRKTDFHLAQDLEKQLRQEHLTVQTGRTDRQTDRQDERYRDKDR
jgi:hypothetical protein